MSLLKSLTNQVKVVIYYDKKDPLYSTLSDLLAEYAMANRGISIQAVDYLRDAAAAQKVKADYKLTAANDKNVIIFDCGGKAQRIDGSALAQYTLEQVPSEKEREYRRKPVAFLGESLFTAALLQVTNPKPLKAYFLQGHGEHQLDSGDQLIGYINFSGVLRQNYMQVEGLSLLGSNSVPMDCDLLVIAGPTTALPEIELERIDQYLAQGGRLLALFNFQCIGKDSGLEKIFAKWGIEVGSNVIADREHTSSSAGSDVIVSAFSKHPMVNPLLGSGLYLVRPRTIGRLNTRTQPADAPRVEEIAFTGPNSSLTPSTSAQTKRDPVGFPVMVAAEKAPIKGVTTERGATRIVAIGDSLLFANNQLELLGQPRFCQSRRKLAARPRPMLGGVGPRPITDYRLVMPGPSYGARNGFCWRECPGAVLWPGALAWARRRR